MTKSTRLPKMHMGKKGVLLLIVLLLIFLLQSLVVLKSTNLTFDEPSAITIGYYFIRNLDTSMFILHPPLAFIVSSFPLLFVDIDTPYSYEKCSDVERYKCAHDFIFRSGNDPEKIGIYARIPFIIISLLLGLLIFFFSKELYGIEAGFFSLILYSFSSAILAFNTIVFTDLIVAFFVFSTIYFLWKLIIHGYTKVRLVLTGVSLGFALASKFTAILLVPIIILLFAVKILKDKNRKKSVKKFSIQLSLILLISLVTLHSTYFFSFDSVANSIPERNVRFIDSLIEENFADGSLSQKVANFLIYDLKMPMPGYMAGFSAQFLTGSLENKRGYLNGEVYEGGKWYYFFEVLLIKSPIPQLIFFLASVLFSIKMFRKGYVNELFIILPIIFFFGVFILSNFNLGLRHMLPIMPFIFVLSSRILNIRLKNNVSKYIFKILMPLLLFWYVLSALLIMPHYMAYFNEFVGGAKNGHEYLLGSNLDMGQNLKSLDNYLKSNKIGTIKLSYHGTFDPSYYDISYEPLPMIHIIPWVEGFSPEGFTEDYKEDCSKKYGIVAISVTNLHNYWTINRSCFDWLRDYEPVKRLGYTIYVYNITD